MENLLASPWLLAVAGGALILGARQVYREADREDKV